MANKRLKKRKGIRNAGTEVIFRLLDPVLGIGATLSIPAFDVNEYDSARGRISVDQAVTVSVFYGQDGDEDDTATTTALTAGECVPLSFDNLEETLRITIENTSGIALAALKFAIRARS